MAAVDIAHSTLARVPANDVRAEEASRRIRAHIAQMRAEGRTSTREERRAWIDEGRR